jgi:hypothetical protein
MLPAIFTSPPIAKYKEAEVALLNYRAALDVAGKGYNHVSDRDRKEIIRYFRRNRLNKNMIAVTILHTDDRHAFKSVRSYFSLVGRFLLA